MSIVEIIAAGLILLGALVMFIGALGVVRFPDLYTRLHAAGKGDTLGQGLVFAGLLIITVTDGELLSFATVFKIIVIVVLVLFLNPTATHALARSAWVIGIKPWTGEGEKHLADDRQKQDEEDAWKI